MNKFTIIETSIKDLIVIKGMKFVDIRGDFQESYNENEFLSLGLEMKFLQDNEVKSVKNVLRGLHFQTNNPQGKLIRCSLGLIYDVAVDLRKDSDTYLKWYGIELSDDNNLQLYIPEGFAHGYYVLSDYAIVNYKCTELYDPLSESGIRWDDDLLDIDWPISNMDQLIISDKDKNLKYVSEVFGVEL